MIDREQAIEAATRAYVSHPLTIERRVEAITDAILALPDPVHEAARRVVTADERGSSVQELFGSIAALRVALSAERVPTPVTDEMVERAMTDVVDATVVEDVA